MMRKDPDERRNRLFAYGIIAVISGSALAIGIAAATF